MVINYFNFKCVIAFPNKTDAPLSIKGARVAPSNGKTGGATPSARRSSPDSLERREFSEDPGREPVGIY
jgi:hypothetical protein